MIISTLCYLIKNDSMLMLLRNRKKDDVNEGKWIGVGGRLDPKESPDECLTREVKEETGLSLSDYRMRGILSFSSEGYEEELIFLYTSESFSGELSDCNEGELSWIPFSKLPDLNLWEGDRIFLKLLLSDSPFFTLKLSYDGDSLRDHSLRIDRPSSGDRRKGTFRYYCPCCGSFTLTEKNAYEICSCCGWEDDPKQEKDPFLAGGANKMSLIEAKNEW